MTANNLNKNIKSVEKVTESYNRKFWNNIFFNTIENIKPVKKIFLSLCLRIFFYLFFNQNCV